MQYLKYFQYLVSYILLAAHPSISHAQSEFLKNLLTQTSPCAEDVAATKWTACVGVVKYTNSASYEGVFQNGEKHGLGKYVSPKGITYIGAFKDAQPHGTGTLISAQGDSIMVNHQDGERVSQQQENRLRNNDQAEAKQANSKLMRNEQNVQGLVSLSMFYIYPPKDNGGYASAPSANDNASICRPNSEIYYQNEWRKIYCAKAFLLQDYRKKIAKFKDIYSLVYSTPNYRTLVGLSYQRTIDRFGNGHVRVELHCKKSASQISMAIFPRLIMWDITKPYGELSTSMRVDLYDQSISEMSQIGMGSLNNVRPRKTLSFDFVFSDIHMLERNKNEEFYLYSLVGVGGKFQDSISNILENQSSARSVRVILDKAPQTYQRGEELLVPTILMMDIDELRKDYFDLKRQCTLGN